MYILSRCNEIHQTLETTDQKLLNTCTKPQRPKSLFLSCTPPAPPKNLVDVVGHIFVALTYTSHKVSSINEKNPYVKSLATQSFKWTLKF